jgi:very-short-patch-repair endonuclease
MGYAKYCSNICRKKDKEKVLRVCELCNKEFWVIPSEITRGGGKYCSRDCTYKGQIKKIKTKCLVCAKDIDVTPAHKERGNGQFCSYTCATIWRNRNQKKRDTKIELLLKEWLIENEIEFIPQYNTGYGSVDFFIPPNICLFADGDYWHGPKIPEQLERDALQNENLKMKGFNVIRLKENEIKQGKRPTEIIEYYNKYKEKNKLGGV